MKYFIITVDTEGDNLWSYKEGDEIGVQNSEYLPRFQNLCEIYGYKPVYLTNYEMANSDVFISEAKKWLEKDTCEIGVHLHAWNNPPYYKLQGEYNENSYLIEYPEEIMRAKFKVIYDLIVKNFGVKPISHRAGRWAMDDRYFKIFKDFDIKIDCSYTPGIDWTSSKGVTMGGSDYSKESKGIQYINGVLEVPATTRFYRSCLNGSIKHRIKTLLKGEYVWLRPALSSLQGMKKVIDIIDKETDIDFVEFMIHSSEVMPNGSPYFTSINAIEREYEIMNLLFAYAKSKGFVGSTLAEYYESHSELH